MILFACPNCGAEYKVVRIEASPTDEFREVTCKPCGGPLRGRDGESILKYFLIKRGGRRPLA